MNRKEEKKELARLLYLGGSGIQEVAEKVSCSRQTVSQWIKKNGWKEIRAAKNITRPELVNKLLRAIDTLIETVTNSDDPSQIAGLGDKLSKLSSTIEKLDKKANVVQMVDVFTAFHKWLEGQAQYDPEITVEFLRKLNTLQNKYMMEKMDSIQVIGDI